MANFLLICLNKTDSGPAIMISMAKSLAADNKNYICCIASDKVHDRNAMDELIEFENIDVEYLDSGNRKTIVTKTCKFLSAGVKELEEKYKNIEFDLSIQIMAHIWGKQINSHLNIKHSSVICHDPTPHSGESLINILFSRYAYNNCDSLLVLSESFIDDAVNRYNKPVYSIKHGLFSTYRTEKPKGRCENLTFLFFGRIEKYKGIDILIEAFDRLLKIDKSVCLTISGRGDLSEFTSFIESFGSNVVVHNKYLSDDEIVDLFNTEGTVLVLPYIDATQSGVIPIAIDYGMPTIASFLPGLVEQLDNGKAGLFFEPGNVDSLFQTMKLFVDDPDLYKTQTELIKRLKGELEWNSILLDLLKRIKES